MTDSRGHGLHRNSMEKQVHLLRTTEQALTIFGRNFPNEVRHSSHMTSDTLIIHVSINEGVPINVLRKQTRRCDNIFCYISEKN